MEATNNNLGPVIVISHISIREVCSRLEIKKILERKGFPQEIHEEGESTSRQLCLCGLGYPGQQARELTRAPTLLNSGRTWKGVLRGDETLTLDLDRREQGT